MIALLILIGRGLALAFRGHHELVLENLALRHQLMAARRAGKRSRLHASDRFFWIVLARMWRNWRTALVLVQPDTVVRGIATGFGAVGPDAPDVPAVHRSIRRSARSSKRWWTSNPLWGAPRIHGELRMLGIEVSERTVSRLLERHPRLRPQQTWKAFLRNHLAAAVSMDFFTVPTLTGRILFVLVILSHHRRRILHVNVTEHPTATWAAQQLVDAFPHDTAPRWLHRDRDGIFGDVFQRRVAGMGIAQVVSAPASPWQNPFAERLIGSIRRESLDHVIIINEAHLRNVLSTPTTFSTSAQRTDLYHRVLEQIQAVPGVESAGITGDLFTANPRERVLTVERDDGTVSERLRFTRDEGSADFFRTLGTPLLRGRFFSIGDRPEAPRVAIINDAMARRSWPGHDPVGRRVRLGPRDSDGPWYTVVGVVGDMRRQGPEREALPQIFEAIAQNPPPSVDLFIRTSSDDPLTMAGALRAAVRRVEKNAPIYGVAPLEQQLGTYLVQRRFQTSLLTGFSIVALLMAAVGIYGLIQYSIATRIQEIGLRMAIGARAGDIFRMIIREGLTLSLTGLALGLVGAWWLGRAGSSLLFGVTATDPLTFMTVSLLLTAVAITACYFPARRAMRVDPIAALRVT